MSSPIVFRAVKHHLGAARDQVRRLDPWAGVEGWVDATRKIRGLVDLYTGGLAPASLEREVDRWLSERRIGTGSAWERWLEVNGRPGHRGRWVDVELSDGSHWTLRLGPSAEFWIHLHPSRHSPFSVRLRAATWSTVLVAALLRRRGLLPVDAVARARDLLGLPPLTGNSRVVMRWLAEFDSDCIGPGRD